jgi:DNA replication protein DnaC
MPTATHDLSSLPTTELRDLLAKATRLTDSPTCKCGKRKEAAVPATHGCWWESQWYYPAGCAECEPEAAAIVDALLASIERDRAVERRAKQREQLVAEIGPRHADCAADNFVPTTDSQRRALETVRDRWWDPRRFILLAGPPGTGKTHLAAVAYRTGQEAYLAEGKDSSPLFVRETQFLHDWRQAAAKRATFDGVEGMTSAGLLILDDAGTGRYTDGSLELLYQVIDTRYIENLPTIITTNLDLEGLESRWGEKLVSRIVERGRSEVIWVEGENYRTRAA